MIEPTKLGHSRLFQLALQLGILGIAGFISGSARGQQTTFAANAQHTGIYNVPVQTLNLVHWSTPIDLVNTGALAHYGAPLITPANTVLTPVRTQTGFQVRAFEGATGRLKYTLNTDYILPTPPTNSWVPVYQPLIATPESGARLYYAGAGGTVYYVTNLDSDTPSVPVHQCFYTNLAAYGANAADFNSTIFINTPLTADSNGVVFFGFRVEQTAPEPLNTTQSGFARIDPQGNATYVLAGAAAADAGVGRDSHNCAPALSNDGSILYVAVKDLSTALHGYLLGLNSTNLTTLYRVQLRDPISGNYAGVLDDGTASPTVGPDGDVFFGVGANPSNGRGYLLHFSADLSARKTPSGFGWDYTPVIVPTNMVPDYAGPSGYLLFSKYNSYVGFADGDGVNKIALLDPNATQIDPHPSAAGLVEMREVMTVIGCTPDEEHQSLDYPYSAREWCINTAAANPATKSVFATSEDGRIYRWNLASNSLSETMVLGPGVGAPYVPTMIGPDGAVYAINSGKLFSLGSPTNMSLRIFSSAPDLCNVVVGQPVTFTTVVTNFDAAGMAPTGTVTFQDLTYNGLETVTNTLATNVPLSNGLAAVTTSALSAGGGYLGNHFITANYSGDAIFPQGSVTLVQKVHARATLTSMNSVAAAPGGDDSVTFTSTVTSIPAGGTPSGMVSFWDGSIFIGQVALDTNGIATLIRTGLSGASHAIAASYYSDTVFASSSGKVAGTQPQLGGMIVAGTGAFRMSFSNVSGAPFTVLGSTNISAPGTNWAVVGVAMEIFPGQFRFTDEGATNGAQRFYRVRSP